MRSVFRHFIFVCMILVLAGVLTACGGGEPAEKKPVAPASAYFEQQYFFSNPEKKDIFRLEYHGQSILDTTLSFTIRTAEGNSLFSSNLDPAQFLPLDSADSLNPQQKEEIITQKLKEMMEAPQKFSPEKRATQFPFLADSSVRGIVFELGLPSHGAVLWVSGSTGKLSVREAEK